MRILRSSSYSEDAMGFTGNEWDYETDIPAPPPTDLPEDQHNYWVWCEYDLRKKHDPGVDFKDLMADLNLTIEAER